MFAEVAARDRSEQMGALPN